MKNTIPFPSEKSLENYIDSKLVETQVCPIDNMQWDYSFTQVHFGDFGITDIVKVKCLDDCVIVAILELKNVNLEPKHLAQLSRYMDGLKSFIKYKLKNKIKIKIIGQLAGPIDMQSNIVFLAKNLKNITLYNVGCDLDSGFLCNEFNKDIMLRARNYGEIMDCIREVHHYEQDVKSFILESCKGD